MARGLEDLREARTVEPAHADRASEPLGRDGRSTVPTQHLDLPRTDRREPVAVGTRTVDLRASEVRILATVGAFRHVPARDLEGTISRRDAWRGDLQHLADQRLVDRASVIIGGRAEVVVTLTRDGRDLLNAHLHAGDGRAQTYYAGLVKPRELAHDAQLYRLFQTDAAKLEAAGHHITRIVLDHELKALYARGIGLEREGGRAAREELDVDAALDLPMVDGHVQFPDLRIEYETPDGRLEHRDLELVTAHYSRGQLAAKARAGFTCYRFGGRRSGSGSSAGTPYDPHLLDWLT